MAEQEVVRRLSVVVAADVFGYSRLMEMDEAGTVAQLKALRKELLDPKIAEYRGRIVKTTGDGILLEYASVTDAVQCNVEIQEAMAQRNASLPEDRRIQFRIGINLGEIIIEGNDIYGNGVNVAARLEALAEPGGICISGNVHDQIRSILSLGYEDLGEQSVKNISTPVRSFAVRMGLSDEGTGPTGRRGGPATRQEKPAIAVLPFENMSGDPEQEYFADGMAEDLITALSHFRWFFVIARNSSFTYKGQAAKVQRIAQELGARYVVEGSVRKSGDRVRITVQLIDAETGHHLWAERYDRKMEDIFAVQDEVTDRIVTVVAPELERVELQRSSMKRHGDLQAWDFFLRGTAHMNEFSKEGNAKARKMFESAVALDPAYSRGHAGLSYSHYRDVLLDFADDPEKSARECLAAAQRAVSLDDTDAFAHFALSRGLHVAGQLDQALSEAKLAIQLNPNDSLGHASLGVLLIAAGRHDEGVSALNRALQLSPRDPRSHLYLAYQSIGLFLDGRYDDAADVARDAGNKQPDDPAARILLAAILAKAGQTDEAAAVLARGEPIDRTLFDRLWVFNWMGSAGRDLVEDGLREAGWSG